MPVLKFYPEHGVRKSLDDLALHFNVLFFCHNEGTFYHFMLKVDIVPESDLMGKEKGLLLKERTTGSK